jgi:hypothetical protein
MLEVLHLVEDVEGEVHNVVVAQIQGRQGGENLLVLKILKMPNCCKVRFGLASSLTRWPRSRTANPLVIREVQ